MVESKTQWGIEIMGTKGAWIGLTHHKTLADARIRLEEVRRIYNPDVEFRLVEETTTTRTRVLRTERGTWPNSAQTSAGG